MTITMVKGPCKGLFPDADGTDPLDSVLTTLVTLPGELTVDKLD